MTIEGITNPQALRDAAKYAAEHPEHFDMESWVTGPFEFSDYPLADAEPEFDEKGMPGCGTTMCLAGTTVYQSGLDRLLKLYSKDPSGSNEFIEKEAFKILTGSEEYHPDLYRLFRTYVINPENVMQAVDIFLESGYEAMQAFLDNPVPD